MPGFNAADVVARSRGIPLRSNNISRPRRYLGQIANRCNMCTSLTTSNHQQMSRSGHFASDHITGLQVELSNYSTDATGHEVGTGGPADFDVSIEYPAGVFTQKKFGGVVGVTAQSKTKILSDYLPINIPKGKLFWVKVWRSDPLGIIYQGSTFFKSTSLYGDAFNFSTTTVPNTVLNATATNLDATNLYTPSAIIGYTKYGTLTVFGDSLVAGQGDTPDAAGVTGLFRFLGTNFGWINNGRTSDRAAWFLADSVLRRDVAKWTSDIAVQHAINDLGSGGSTAAQLEANLVAIGNALRTAYPDKRLWLCTSTPQTTDATNTTPSSTNANRILVNDWKRSIPSPFDGCLEFADALENSRNGGLFATTAHDVDGTHITQAGYQAITASGFVDAASFAVA